MWTESESDQEPSDAAKVPGVVQAHWVYQGWEAVVGLSRVRAQRLRTPLSQNGSQVLSRLIYCSADWPGLEHTGTSFLLEITDSTFKSLFKWTQCGVFSCSVLFQLSRQINLTCKVVKSYGGKSSDKNSFLFLLSSQKLRLDDVSIWQKFPLVNRKECKCPTWGSKPRPTSHQTKFTSKSLFQIWYFNFFSQMNILAINVRWKLSTLWKLVTKSWQMKLECVKKFKFEGRLQYLILFVFSENSSKRKYNQLSVN